MNTTKTPISLTITEDGEYRWLTFGEVYEALQAELKHTVDSTCEYDACGEYGPEQNSPIIKDGERFIRMITHDSSGHCEGRIAALSIVLQTDLVSDCKIRTVYFIKHFKGPEHGFRLIREIQGAIDSDYL
tara:strand:+ start:47 stop:436 length:390 start_codon:yes stop_codon:yes gene_type:complete